MEIKVATDSERAFYKGITLKKNICASIGFEKNMNS